MATASARQAASDPSTPTTMFLTGTAPLAVAAILAP
jgi:hypothetical protein